MALRLISEYPATTRPAFITLGKITKIGRNFSNDVILCSSRQVAGIRGTVTPSSWISRSHAVIYKELEGYYIEDFSSTGTYMNYERLPKGKRILLEDGVEIFFGVDSFKHRKPPKMGEKSKDISDFLFVFEKSVKPLKRKTVSQSFDKSPLQMSNKRMKFERSPLQVLNSRKAPSAENQTTNHKLELDCSNSETQLPCDIENYETPMKILTEAQLMKTQLRRNNEELPYQQTISTLRDMLKTEREEKAVTVEQIQANARQREADLSKKSEKLEEERKLRESELSELRLAMAQQKAQASAEISRFKEKIKQLKSEVCEKEKRNSDYMENIIAKLTADHKKEIAEQTQRIRELELSRPAQARREIVVLQFGERPTSQTRRCQVSLDWTVERLCELVHRKYVKKLPGSQMEVVLHRTYSVMEHTKKLDSFALRKGELLVIRKSFVLTHHSNISVNTEAFCENVQNDGLINRRPSLLPTTPMKNAISGQMYKQTVIKDLGEQKESTNDPCNLSPILGGSRIRSYRDKMEKPVESAMRQFSKGDRTVVSNEPSIDVKALRTDIKTKASKVMMEMEMEDEELVPQISNVGKPLSKKGKRKLRRTKSLINPKLKPKNLN